MGVNLTDAAIKALGRQAVREGLKELKTKDATTRGLLLVSKESGVQEWRYRFRQHGRDRVTVLGKFPKMTLAKAREEAQKARQRVEAGEDIHESKRAARQPFSAFLDEYWKRWKTGKRQGSIDTVKSKVKLLKSKLGDTPVSMISTSKIADALSGEPASVAHRCLHICQQTLRIAVISNARPDNPARELKSSDIPSAAKVRVPRTAVPLADVLSVIEQVSERSVVSSDALMIMALCATRAEETVLAEWTHIDWEHKTWFIPAANRKGRLEVRHPLTTPLSNHAVSVLREIAEQKLSSKWLFPGNMGGHTDRRTVLHNLKLVAPTATLHGFRSLFSTAANDSGAFDGDVIEVALGHSLRGVKGVYDKGTRLERRRALMEWWGNCIMGNESKLIEFPAAVAS
jgi:integrase